MTENFLGYVIWYSVSSKDLVPLSKLEAFREELDPMIKLPKKPSKLNLLKRSCKEVKWKEDNDIFSFESNDKNSFVGIHNSTILGVVYLDKNNEMQTEPHFVDNETWEKACHLLKNKMLSENHVDHMAVRSVIKDTIERRMKGVWLNSGTYFIKTNNTPKLEKLKELISTVNGSMDFIPLIDDARSREIVEDGYRKLILNMDFEFFEKLASLGSKPSAYKVNQLEKIISDVKKIELELSLLGFTSAESEFMKSSLEKKLSNGV